MYIFISSTSYVFHEGIHCEHKVIVTMRKLLYQRDYGGDDYEDNGERATVWCEVNYLLDLILCWVSQIKCIIFMIRARNHSYKNLFYILFLFTWRQFMFCTQWNGETLENSKSLKWIKGSKNSFKNVIVNIRLLIHFTLKQKWVCHF